MLTARLMDEGDARRSVDFHANLKFGMVVYAVLCPPFLVGVCCAGGELAWT